MDFLRARLPEGAEADRLVERALFLAATGYCYTEERRESTEKGGEKVVAELDEAFQADDSVDHETGLPLEQENGEDAPASTTEPLVNKF